MVNDDDDDSKKWFLGPRQARGQKLKYFQKHYKTTSSVIFSPFIYGATLKILTFRVCLEPLTNSPQKRHYRPRYELQCSAYTQFSQKQKNLKKTLPVDHACILSSRCPNKNSQVKFFNFYSLGCVIFCHLARPMP